MLCSVLQVWAPATAWSFYAAWWLSTNLLCAEHPALSFPPGPALQLRREAGNAAAREAAASARRQRLEGAAAEEVAAARAAAHQAAADAADACGSCEALHGEKEELDAVWLPCDTCHR